MFPILAGAGDGVIRCSPDGRPWFVPHGVGFLRRDYQPGANSGRCRVSAETPAWPRAHVEDLCFNVLTPPLGGDPSHPRTGPAARAFNGIRLAIRNLTTRLRQTLGSLGREHTLNPNLWINRRRVFKNQHAVGTVRSRS